MAHRHRGNRDLRRERATRRRNPVILVVCDGEESEFHYFCALRQEIRNPGCRVVAVTVRSGGYLKVAVERAIRSREERCTEPDDEAWVVCDVDGRDDRLPEARALAKRNGLLLAVSNPRFELWALLHFKRLGTASITDGRRKLDAPLRRQGIEPHGKFDYRKLSPNYDTAVKNARDLDGADDPAQTSLENPSTDVWRLTERIRRLQ